MQSNTGKCAFKILDPFLPELLRIPPLVALHDFLTQRHELIGPDLRAKIAAVRTFCRLLAQPGTVAFVSKPEFGYSALISQSR